MKKILDLITDEVTKAFTECGYDAKYAKVTLSNRPDLCEYQCNGAMAAAKEYKKAPFMIADEVVEKLAVNPMFAMAESVKPGFLNLKIDEAYLADYVAKMQEDDGRFGCEKTEAPKTIMIDYGGPNVAKPLHVGHLRSAIIGESVKRIGKFMGHNVIGDVHLGDWGLQMGLIITELKQRRPELVYFNDTYTGEAYGIRLKVCVVDERSEIAASFHGVPQNDMGPRTDVMDGCGKAEGMQLLIRSMSPQIIAVDELGAESDFYAVEQALNCGSRVLGTIHAGNMKELSEKPYLKRWMERRLFQRFIFLEKEADGRRKMQVYDEHMERITC